MMPYRTNAFMTSASLAAQPGLSAEPALEAGFEAEFESAVRDASLRWQAMLPASRGLRCAQSPQRSPGAHEACRSWRQPLV